MNHTYITKKDLSLNVSFLTTFAFLIKKPRYSFFLYLFYLISSLSCQIEPFQKIVENFNEHFVRGVCEGPDGNIFVVSGLQSSNDYVIYEFDIEGDLVNDMRVSSSTLDNIPTGIVSTGDGNIVALSWLFDDNPFAENGGAMIKFNPSGSVLWTRQFGELFVGLEPNDIIVDRDDNIVFAGAIPRVGDGGVRVYDAAIGKLSSNGSVLFRNRTVNGLAVNDFEFDYFLGVAEASDGYIAVGLNNFYNPPGEVSTFSLMVVKYGINGNIISDYLYTEERELYFEDVEVLVNENNEIFIAYTNRVGAQLNNENTQDINIIKLNPTTLEVQWSKRIRQDSGLDDLEGMNFSHDGNIIINGYSEGVGFGGSEAFVLEISQEGQLLDSKLFGGSGNENIKSVLRISDDNCSGYMLFGTTSSFGQFNPAFGWVIKTDQNFGAFENCETSGVPFILEEFELTRQPYDGENSSWDLINNDQEFSVVSNNGFITLDIPDCSAAPVSSCVPSSIGYFNDVVNIDIYPNPVENTFSISIEGINMYSVTICDIYGKVIVKFHGNNFNDIDMTNYSSGIYFVNVFESRQGLLKSKKIIVK